MRFLVDSSLPRSAAALLRQMGHEAVDARDVGMRSAPDDIVAAHGSAISRR
jgi:predicted nuclease of predicted toxin-antitoxin system